MRQKKIFMERKKITLAYIKRLAKNLKKEHRITHTQGLEMAAKAHGYSNWLHCSRSLSQQQSEEKTDAIQIAFKLSFTDWLKRHSKRNSPLGDLSNDMLQDSTWPDYNTLEEYTSYLLFRGASHGAVSALKKAWKSYNRYVQQKQSSIVIRSEAKKVMVKDCDTRKIVYVKNVTPLHYAKRSTEKFVVGDKAWISWNARKAIPVTITKVDSNYYSFRIERPLSKAGEEYYLHLDEVRSTPELACLNCVTS